MEQQMESQQINQSGNKLPITVAISVLLTAIVIGGAVYFWQKSTNEKVVGNLEQKISDLEKEISTIKSASQENSQANPTPITSSQPSDEDANWKTYSGDKYGVTFSYPSNFQIVTDKIQDEHKGHPKGFNWYRIELTDSSATEKPFMRFEIDPGGYGPFFPDKTYQIAESGAKKIVINSVNDSSSENSNDGRILIIPSILEASNGHSYYWQFYFNEGGKDYEPIFKQILSTFQFSK